MPETFEAVCLPCASSGRPFSVPIPQDGLTEANLDVMRLHTEHAGHVGRSPERPWRGGLHITWDDDRFTFRPMTPAEEAGHR